MSSKSSYALYDTCDKCPLRVYIDVICNENLQALVSAGEATEADLLACRAALISEFNELSGRDDTSAAINQMRNIQLYRTQWLGLALCAELIAAGRPAEAFAFMERNGVPVGAEPETEAEWMKLGRKLEARIRLLKVKIREEANKHRDQAARNDQGGRPTPGDFNDQLIALSKHVGYRLNQEISLAEYAGYLKDFKNASRHGKHNTK